jgi:YD repeat-containing protein
LLVTTRQSASFKNHRPPKLTYNDVSNITQRETEHGLYTYSYDDLDRLTQVVPPASVSFPNAPTNNTTNPNLGIKGVSDDK